MLKTIPASKIFWKLHIWMYGNILGTTHKELTDLKFRVPGA